MLKRKPYLVQNKIEQVKSSFTIQARKKNKSSLFYETDFSDFSLKNNCFHAFLLDFRNQ